MEMSERQALAVAPVAFADTRYRSRVIVFPDGSSATVFAGKIEVTTPEHVAYLESSPSFTRIPAKEQ